jgi:hypothetical protein
MTVTARKENYYVEAEKILLNHPQQVFILLLSVTRTTCTVTSGAVVAKRKKAIFRKKFER